MYLVFNNKIYLIFKKMEKNSNPVKIIYTLIARASKIVLCDFTEFSGNFQQISLVLLNKIKKNSKCEVEYNQ